MEKVKQYRKAIEVLEIVHADCLKWIEQLGGKEGNEAKRSRVLGKTVGISVKLGELYSSDEINDLEAAEENLMYSVTAVLKEKKRRAEEGVKEDLEGPWMTDEEVGGSLEGETQPPFMLAKVSTILTKKNQPALANHYETRNQHYLAAPLYLQALTLIPHSNCHSVVLSNYPPPHRTAFISRNCVPVFPSHTTSTSADPPLHSSEQPLHMPCPPKPSAHRIRPPNIPRGSSRQRYAMGPESNYRRRVHTTARADRGVR